MSTTTNKWEFNGNFLIYLYIFLYIFFKKYSIYLLGIGGIEETFYSETVFKENVKNWRRIIW